ncbi:hypothetical protein HYH03_002513 [Edaphochlamys debaryana]|uniref:BZIP domain-containing protein n=1 Tax=Edaphochlamys debaryana TaxID=47281 RepID=A0A835YE43_9CHLO|nr:hypothetical protein HYH03_002513 [Edaphochlamys debaryana]|eukprot:KAG2499568.1 hypothetical protein HYH03_002513 [Edaphochlamys debaryana]
MAAAAAHPIGPDPNLKQALASIYEHSAGFLNGTDGSEVNYAELFSLLEGDAYMGDEDAAAATSSGSHPISPQGSAGSPLVVPASTPIPPLLPVPAPSTTGPAPSSKRTSRGGQRAADRDRDTARDTGVDTSKRTREGGATAAAKGGKQAQVKELEAIAAQKSADLERLQRENEELKFKQKLLEKVVVVRDHQLKVMKGHLELLPQPWCNQQQPGVSACSAGGLCRGSGTDGSGPLSAAEQIRTQPGACLFGSADVVLPDVNVEMFRTLGKQQLIDGWKHFLSEVSIPLLALETNSDDEAAASKLRQLAAEVSFMLKHASLLAPDTMMVAMQTHLETMELAAPEPEHWRHVLRTLELTPTQTAELVAVYRLFEKLMASIHAERRHINAHLAKGLEAQHSEARFATAQTTVSPECEVLQMLQRSMRREKAAHLLLRGYTYGATLTALQFVKLGVYCYPHMPDANPLLGALAELVAAGDAP